MIIKGKLVVRKKGNSFQGVRLLLFKSDVSYDTFKSKQFLTMCSMYENIVSLIRSRFKRLNNAISKNG
jgi:hypothetical protein